MSEPEAWLLGPVEGIPPALMPVAHALVQARREIAHLRETLSDDQARSTAGTAAPVGFHLAHLDGSLDRLFTYAGGHTLAPAQLETLRQEPEDGRRSSARTLCDRVITRLDACLETVERTDPGTLHEPRAVGRDRLPSTVGGLLFHAAEHTTMHVGQIRTTLKALAGRADT